MITEVSLSQFVDWLSGESKSLDVQDDLSQDEEGKSNNGDDECKQEQGDGISSGSEKNDNESILETLKNDDKDLSVANLVRSWKSGNNKNGENTAEEEQEEEVIHLVVMLDKNCPIGKQSWDELQKAEQDIGNRAKVILVTEEIGFDPIQVMKASRRFKFLNVASTPATFLFINRKPVELEFPGLCRGQYSILGPIAREKLVDFVYFACQLCQDSKDGKISQVPCEEVTFV